MRIGPHAAEGEFDRMRLAGDRGETLSQGSHDRALTLIFRRHLARRAREGGIAGDAIEVFDRDRQALHRAEVHVGGEGGVGDRCLRAQRFRIPGFIDVQRFTMRGVVFDRALGKADGGYFAAAQVCLQVFDGSCAQLGRCRHRIAPFCCSRLGAYGAEFAEGSIGFLGPRHSW
jgi:hypothetical protein